MNIYEVIIRLLLAVFVGGLVGYEREFKNRPAGFRTHILVCLGAAIISMIQLYTIDDTVNLILAHPQLAASLKVDIGRLGAQVITGVGFLGAGTIIHEKGSVKGLTTAASLWVVACIGLAIGLGYYVLTILTSILVFIVLVSLKSLESKFFEKGTVIKFEIIYSDRKTTTALLGDFCQSRNIKIKNIEFIMEEDNDNATEAEEGTQSEYQYHKALYTVLMPRYMKKNAIIKELSGYETISRVNLI